MARSLASYPESEREAAARRRVAAETGGIGFHAAKNFLARKAKADARKKAEAAEKAVRNG